MKSAFKLNWLYNMESLTRGTHWSVDPTGQRDKNRLELQRERVRCCGLPSALSELVRAR